MWDNTPSDLSFSNGQQTILHFSVESDSRESGSSITWSVSHTMCRNNTTQPYLSDTCERRDRVMQSVVLSDVVSSGEKPGYSPPRQPMSNISRSLFAPNVEESSLCSVEEKTPVNSEVAVKQALTIHRGARSLLQSYRSLKFSAEQRMYRRYFAKWMHFKREGTTLNTSSGEAQGMFRSPLQDSADAIVVGSAPAKSTPLSPVSSANCGLSSTRWSGSTKRNISPSVEAQCGGFPYDSQQGALGGLEQALAHVGQRSTTPCELSSSPIKDSSLFSCISSIRADGCSPVDDDLQCSQMPLLSAISSGDTTLL
uniref:Uncharacterized protein TCIL3000_8_7130 n=1 Tax=Trypanosoma congolense (strain IL3000) TaxID=1068625 RepID=G0USX2_TRYCI|nr:unnamed protein product [Trypanosoma congolense IL3000]